MGSAGSSTIDIHRLTAVVDTVPELRGSGVVYRRGSSLIRVRAQPKGGYTVVFELHERVIPTSVLLSMRERRGPYKDAPNFTTIAQRTNGWSLMKPEPAHVQPLSLVPKAGSSIAKRSGGTSVSEEWEALGFNCGGAALAWVGVAGGGALAPVTGGLTFGASLMLYAGAAAATIQCSASVYRMWNIHRGKKSINDNLDAMWTYKWTMLGLDGIGLAGAGGALLETKAMHGALRAGGMTWGSAIQRTAPSAARRTLAGVLELQAATVGTKMLSRLARQKLLDGAGGVLGVVASVQGGVIRELIVWVAKEAKQS